MKSKSIATTVETESVNPIAAAVAVNEPIKNEEPTKPVKALTDTVTIKLRNPVDAATASAMQESLSHLAKGGQLGFFATLNATLAQVMATAGTPQYKATLASERKMTTGGKIATLTGLDRETASKDALKVQRQLGLFQALIASLDQPKTAKSAAVKAFPHLREALANVLE